MSPKQIRSSRDVDHRADLWSLGVIAYELLVGDAPFHEKKIADLFVEILTRPIAPPSSRRPELPAAVDEWARYALDRDPARRYATAGAMAAALDEALRGVRPRRPEGAAAVGGPTAPTTAPAERPSAATLAAMAAAIVLVAVLTVLALRAW